MSAPQVLSMIRRISMAEDVGAILFAGLAKLPSVIASVALLPAYFKSILASVPVVQVIMSLELHAYPA